MSTHPDKKSVVDKISPANLEPLGRIMMPMKDDIWKRYQDGVKDALTFIEAMPEGDERDAVVVLVNTTVCCIFADFLAGVTMGRMDLSQAVAHFIEHYQTTQSRQVLESIFGGIMDNMVKKEAEKNGTGN